MLQHNILSTGLVARTATGAYWLFANGKINQQESLHDASCLWPALVAPAANHLRLEIINKHTFIQATQVNALNMACKYHPGIITVF